MRKPRIFKTIGVWGLLGMALVGVASASQDDLNIGYCANCSSSAFTWAAYQSAPMSPGIHSVYVIDTIFGEVRYFDVNVWWDCGGNHVQSQGDSVDELTGENPLSNCTQKEVVQGVGDASIIYEIQNAHDAVTAFASPQAFEFDSGDIPNSGDSAIDLIGPGAAGLARRNLQNGIEGVLESRWRAQLFELSDIAQRLANRLIGTSNYIGPQNLITVTWPDGTSIKLVIALISTGVGPGTSTQILVEILPETIRLPNGETVPLLGEEFDGFSHTGHPDLIGKLFDLANRFGIPITSGGGGGPTIVCIRDDEGITCFPE